MGALAGNLSLTILFWLVVFSGCRRSSFNTPKIKGIGQSLSASLAVVHVNSNDCGVLYEERELESPNSLNDLS
jgi:hypothetical protein